MGNDSNVLKLTGSGTTTLNGAFLFNICVNKTLTGTMTVNENGVAVGAFAIGTVTGNYHQNPNGARYYKLTIALSAGDDVTLFTKTIV
jgi:hypothetical protein